MMKAIFKSFYFKYQDFWKISNDTFKKCVEARYMVSDPDYRKEVHDDIVEAMRPTNPSIRKYEEITNQLFNKP